jgi:hypothetical protein
MYLTTLNNTYTTVGKTSLDEGSALRGDYLTTYNTHNRQTSMIPAGLEPATSASERQQTARLSRSGHVEFLGDKLTLEEIWRKKPGRKAEKYMRRRRKQLHC